MVYLVGAGPGDRELITLKGKRAIEEADIIFYDRLINTELLTFAKENVELVYCGKKPNDHSIKQETINKLLVKHAQKGKVVTRLKGGDPFIYGRGGEEAEQLAQHRVPFEVVPGISAGIAAPAYAGIPVTHRKMGRSFAVITGHTESIEQTNWSSYVEGIDTLVIYMGSSTLEQIVQKLVSSGKNQTTPAAIIHWGTTAKQEVITGTLHDLVEKAHAHSIKNPSIIVIGEVVALHEKINWFYPDLPLLRSVNN